MIRRVVMPDWWDWELEFYEHLGYRMADRRFNETELRTMFAQAQGARKDEEEPGRWVVEVRWEGRPWHIIVEPDFVRQILLVVTAFKVE